jgi:hypothetical protein
MWRWFMWGRARRPSVERSSTGSPRQHPQPQPLPQPHNRAHHRRNQQNRPQNVLIGS